MSNEHNQVFVLGAAGYIGGAILVGYKKAFPTFHYTALIRNKDYVPAFEGERDDACKPATTYPISIAIGVKTVIGDHSELVKITDLVAQADIVLNAADADDFPLTKAVLNGLKIRSASVGLKPILIHTSGTGVASDHAEGEYRDEKPLYDASELSLLPTPSGMLTVPSG
jgi:nucleoside-diphosphate-sugar epimerase